MRLKLLSLSMLGLLVAVIFGAFSCDSTNSEVNAYGKRMLPYFTASTISPDDKSVAILEGVMAPDKPSNLWGAHGSLLTAAQSYVVAADNAAEEEAVAQRQEDRSGGDRVTACVNLDEHNDYSLLGFTYPDLKRACDARGAAFNAYLQSLFAWIRAYASSCNISEQKIDFVAEDVITMCTQ
jgi:hypothetical protein